MKPRYKQLIVSFALSNERLEQETKDYDIIAVVNTTEGIVYAMKKKSFIERLINKIF
jgi:hypothetical protein